MGTTLTGTTPQDTYEALIKVGDNGIITGSLKTLSDGEGNDTALALSTGAASIAGTLAVTGNAAFDTDVLFVDAANDQVGIGTSSPDTKLQVAGTGATGLSIRANTSGDAFMRYYLDAVIASDSFIDRATGNLNIRINQNGTSIAFSTSAALVERFRITDNGVTFNGDTAAANALDDYEEGTWTMGIAFGGAATGITYGANSGTYTKIGRQVTVNGYLSLSSKGSSTGSLTITGLPFTIGSGQSKYSAVTLGNVANFTFADIVTGYGTIGNTTIQVYETTNAGSQSAITNADFQNNSEFIISFTYFV